MRAHSIAKTVGLVGTMLLCATVAFAQPAVSESEHESHHPAAQSSTASGQGMGMMGGQGMMGGKQMMGMPMMMPCCPCGMMGMGIESFVRWSANNDVAPRQKWQDAHPST
jgi:hypothetical protein